MAVAVNDWWGELETLKDEAVYWLNLNVIVLTVKQYLFSAEIMTSGESRQRLCT